jgi:chromosome condensin MukBEF complex kleisin-like MukF subunit
VAERSIALLINLHAIGRITDQCKPGASIFKMMDVNRPLADLYVRKDYMGHFRIRVQLESGQRYVITIREE